MESASPDIEPIQIGVEPLSRLELARALSLPLSVIKSLTDEVRTCNPECFVTQREQLVVLPDAQYMVQERTEPEEGWLRVDELAQSVSVNPHTVASLARRLSADGCEFEGQLQRRRRRDEDEPTLFINPELAVKVTSTVADQKERQREKDKVEAITNEFATFAQEMKQGETLEAGQFRKLVEMFGPDSCTDLLFQYRPEFSNAPVDMVSSFLTDYLGSFLITKGRLDLENLTMATEFLSNQTLKNSLIEVVKQHCHHFYQGVIRKDDAVDDLTVISDHLSELRNSISNMESEDLIDVLVAVEDYYTFLFVEIEKPDNFVDSLSGDRPFPDLSQRMNVGELVYEDQANGMQKKRRMLYADEPGMGKSASAIMAKEHVGAKCAVIISPGGMVETWKNYLSDKFDDSGKQIGYFKPGQAPRVLVADSPQKLASISTEDYDYIILSHGRLKSTYTDLLKNIAFDMLIVDEAHEFKNIEEGIKSNELIKLSDYVAEQPDSYTLMLSATPAPNKVSDIAMILRVLHPGAFLHEDGTPMTNKELSLRIIKGDYIDLRTMLVPRMQRKLLADSVKMPGVIENTVELHLSKKMQEIYELYLEEDELDSTEKIRRLRQFLNNPAAIHATPDVVSVKAAAVGNSLRSNFVDQKKILMFVNDYVDNIITGDFTIHETLDVPADVKVSTITGATSKSDREFAQSEFQSGDEKMLLIVSGSTAGLGIDLSKADRIVFYNEPWNKSLRQQQVGRANRPGRTKPLYVDTFYFPGTLEEGMKLYAEAKAVAIQKLLHGIELSQLEKDALTKAEQDGTDESVHDINPELAAYYYSSWQRMLRMFGYVKEIGEKDFVEKFLPDHGVEYARTYRELVNRSYQANAARLSGTIIADHFDSKPEKNQNKVILDVASGPEMLKSHIPEELTDSVISLDINPEHFVGEGSNRIAGSMLALPVASESVDYLNMSLALHYSKQIVKKGIHERIETLAEINRVLKTGARATITMLYSYDFTDIDKLEESLSSMGFRLCRRDSGEVKSGDNFNARLITIEKVKNSPNLEDASHAYLQRLSSGLKLSKTELRLRDTKKIVDEFLVKRQRHIKARLTLSDKKVLEEETLLMNEMLGLKKKHKVIKEIPPEEIIKAGFSRIFNGQRHVLFARLQSAIGAIVLR